MREIEKLFKGLPHNSRDTEIREYHALTLTMLHEYNALKPSDPAKKDFLSKLLGGYNDNVFIESDFKCDYGKNIYFKGFCMVNYNCVFLDSNIITIGNMAMIGPGTTLICTNHALDPAERRQGLFDNKPITMGDNVWIGANVTVLPGVIIGDGAVIGAGSVVTKNIPPLSIAVGNPCKVVRAITEADRLDKERLYSMEI